MRTKGRRLWRTARRGRAGGRTVRACRPGALHPAGRMPGTDGQKRRRRARCALTALLILGIPSLLLLAVLRRPAPPLPPYPASRYVRDREGGVLRVLLGPDDTWCVPTSLAQTGDWAARAIVAAEDKRFWTHPGVDGQALLRAAATDLYCRRIVSGASTLTTQLVKLSHPRPRTFRTKLREAIGAVRLEHTYDKEAILEQYLNRTPFGSNIQGIEAAAAYYFNKPACALTLGEASLLLGLPQSPSRLRPDRHLERAMKRRDYVLNRMQELRYITRAERNAADMQPIVPRALRPTFRAPHFVECALREAPSPTCTPPADLQTTLNPQWQQIAEEELNRHVAAHPQVPGGAVVIIDVTTAQVCALVGSPDYDDEIRGGRINGATRRRSPGSTLKPFLYARAFDRGLCLPASVLHDVPMVFADYHPVNFDGSYRGDVRADDALAESLNIPALALTRDLGLPALFHVLRGLHLPSSGATPERCGLSAALGGVEVRLLDLANAYACLARGGLYRPCRFVASPSGQADAVRVFSEAATFLIAEALGTARQNALFRGHGGDVDAQRVAWKSGTSTGGRDAWTVAYTPRTVVAVWLGDVHADHPGQLVGAEHALPLASALVRRLPGLQAEGWFIPPPTVERRLLCTASGQVCNPYCEEARAEWFIPGRSSPALCTRHSRATEGLARSTAGSATASSSAPSHPPPGTRLPLTIRNPVSGSHYRLLPELGEAQVITLEATSPDRQSSGTLYWFANGSPIGVATPAAPLRWPLQAGEHLLACRTADGATDTSRIVVTR